MLGSADWGIASSTRKNFALTFLYLKSKEAVFSQCVFFLTNCYIIIRIFRAKKNDVKSPIKRPLNAVA
jgi:hypothetical protein